MDSLHNILVGTSISCGPPEPLRMYETHDPQVTLLVLLQDTCISPYVALTQAHYRTSIKI